MSKKPSVGLRWGGIPTDGGGDWKKRNYRVPAIHIGPADDRTTGDRMRG
ncbi:hypothetical protein [Planktothrix sp. FACHB-1355]|nr:hypothetical protein [Planktothrix sp. FACHB-1355]